MVVHSLLTLTEGHSYHSMVRGCDYARSLERPTMKVTMAVVTIISILRLETQNNGQSVERSG